MIYNGKVVGVLKGGRGNQDLIETKYEANNLHKIVYYVLSIR